MSKRADIQILRALAVIGVVAFHFDPSRLEGGYLGVDVFFVISGFLITGLIARRIEKGTFRLTDFYLRRIRRLFPALITVLLVTLVAGVAALPPVPFQGLVDYLPFAALQVSNFAFMREVDYFGAATGHNPLLHTWSLGVEEQFYLLWAPMMLAASLFFVSSRFTRKLAWVIGGVIVVSMVSDLLTRRIVSSEVNFFSPLSRFWELGLGGLAAIWNRQIGSRGLSLLGVAGIIGSMVWIGPADGNSLFFRMIPCLFTVLVLMSREAYTFLGAPRGVLVYIGDLSYSIYLWHWPVIVISPYLFSLGDGVLSAMFQLLVIGALSMASFHLIEAPQIRNPRWVRLFDIRSFASVAFLLAVGGGAFALQSEGDAHWRFNAPKPGREEATFLATRTPPFHDIAARDGGGTFPLTESTAVDYVLIGDSHARHFEPMIRRLAEETGKTQMTIHGSAFLAFAADFSIARLDENGGVVERLDWAEDAARLTRALEMNPNIEAVFLAQRTAFYVGDGLPGERTRYRRSVAVSRDGEASGEVYSGALTRFVRSMVDSGKRVFLLGQAPPLRRDPKQGPSFVDRFFGGDWHERDIQYAPVYLERRLGFERDLYRKLSRDGRVTFFDTAGYLKSIYGPDGHVLYEDDDHLNYRGAMFLHRIFSDRFVESGELLSID